MAGVKVNKVPFRCTVFKPSATCESIATAFRYCVPLAAGNGLRSQDRPYAAIARHAQPNPDRPLEGIGR